MEVHVERKLSSLFNALGRPNYIKVSFGKLKDAHANVLECFRIIIITWEHEISNVF